MVFALISNSVISSNEIQTLNFLLIDKFIWNMYIQPQPPPLLYKILIDCTYFYQQYSLWGLFLGLVKKNTLQIKDFVQNHSSVEPLNSP